MGAGCSLSRIKAGEQKRMRVDEMSTTTQEITYQGITAPSDLWSTLFQVNHWSNEPWTVQGSRTGFVRTEDLIALLAEGRRQTGRDDWQALAWVNAEFVRRSEARAASSALQAEAAAISKLADSIRAESNESVLQTVLSRLTERTQYAVRQQLKGSGLLG